MTEAIRKQRIKHHLPLCRVVSCTQHSGVACAAVGAGDRVHACHHHLHVDHQTSSSGSSLAGCRGTWLPGNQEQIPEEAEGKGALRKGGEAEQPDFRPVGGEARAQCLVSSSQLALGFSAPLNPDVPTTESWHIRYVLKNVASQETQMSFCWRPAQ